MLKVNIYLGCMENDTNTMLRKYAAYTIQIQTIYLGCLEYDTDYCVIVLLL